MSLFVLKTWLQARIAQDDRGASLVEYILLVALIALAVIARGGLHEEPDLRQVRLRRLEDQCDAERLI